jgi:hypothetical protein
MKKIKITEHQAKKLGIINENEDNGLKSVNSLLGANFTTIVIEGPTVAKNKEFILARTKKFDPENTLNFFEATGKIVGKVDEKKLKDIANEITKFDSSISVKKKESIKKLSERKNTVKITKEQYNRIFASNLFESMNSTDKMFKKEFSGKDIQNLEEDEFNITKPNTSIPGSAQGKFGKDIVESSENIKQEASELRKYLYGKSDELSPFWSENNITYGEICDVLKSKNIIVDENGIYKLSKSLGSPEKAIVALENELSNLVNSKSKNTTGKQMETEDSRLPFGAAEDPRAPYNSLDNATKPIEPKQKQLEVLAKNNEIAILKSRTGELFLFEFNNVDKNNYMDYASVTRRYVGKDEDGNPDYEYDKDFEIDSDVISNYVNDNIKSLNVGEGISGWEDGYDLIKMDDELKNEIINLYDKDKNIISVLSNLGESFKELDDLKNNIHQPDKDKKVMDKEAITKKLETLKQQELDRRKKFGEISEENGVSTLAISPEMAQNFDEEDYSWWSDRYKDINGFRPRMTNKELIAWVNNTFKLENDEYKLIKNLEETTTAGLASGSFTSNLSLEPIEKETPVDINNMDISVIGEGLGDGYTHYAIIKNENKIVDGWNYNGLDRDEIKHWTSIDLKDNFPDNKLSDFKVISKNNLTKYGLNPHNTKDWYKMGLNEMTSGSIPTYDANALPGIKRNGSFKKSSKTNAQKKTQYAGGSFVDFNDCTKLNNKPAGSGCSQGAVDGVVKLKKTNGNINAPSLS